MTQLVDYRHTGSNRYQVFDVTCIALWVRQWICFRLCTSKLTSHACEQRAGLIRRFTNRFLGLAVFHFIRCSFIGPCCLEQGAFVSVCSNYDVKLLIQVWSS